MIINRKISVLVAFMAGVAVNGCGSKDNGDDSPKAVVPPATTEPAKVDDVVVPPASGSGSVAAPAVVSADTILSDGEALGLRSGDEMVANLLAGARLEVTELSVAARAENEKLTPTLPKAGGGLQTFTAGHLTNGVKILYNVCNAWMKKAAGGKDDRFPATLPWDDGGAVDKIVAYTTFQPVFEAAFWGPDKSNYPDEGDMQSTMFAFNEELNKDFEDPTTHVITSTKFIDSVVANCIVVGLASPAWFK